MTYNVIANVFLLVFSSLEHFYSTCHNKFFYCSDIFCHDNGVIF